MLVRDRELKIGRLQTQKECRLRILPPSILKTPASRVVRQWVLMPAVVVLQAELLAQVMQMLTQRQ